MANSWEALAIGSANAIAKTHAACYLRLVLVIELLLRASRAAVEPDVLREAIGSYLLSFQTLYGAECMAPKFHYMMRYPEFVRRWKRLPNCFALERKRKVPKRYATELRNTCAYWEKSLLRECTSHHLASLASAHFGVAATLIDPRPAPSEMRVLLERAFDTAEATFATTKVARINAWERCSQRDVVMMRRDGEVIVGEVDDHASIECVGEARTFSCLAKWDLLSDARRHQKSKKIGHRFLCMTEELCCALTWVGGGDAVTVLKPSRM
jgi:hypothetical protein